MTKVEEKKEENAEEEIKKEEKEEAKPPLPFVLFVDLHCVGCAKKIERSILKIRGQLISQHLIYSSKQYYYWKF